jgi:hypothetical protein
MPAVAVVDHILVILLLLVAMGAAELVVLRLVPQVRQLVEQLIQVEEVERLGQLIPRLLQVARV